MTPRRWLDVLIVVAAIATFAGYVHSESWIYLAVLVVLVIALIERDEPGFLKRLRRR